MNQNVLWIDNKKKNTLVCIHGYNSSKDFIGEMPLATKDFNILSFTLPGAPSFTVKAQVTFDQLSNAIIQELSKLKHTNIYLLAHSMGGAIVNHMIKMLPAKLKAKIKHIFYISTVHPLLPHSTISRILNLYLAPKNKATKIASSTLKLGVKVAQKTFKKDFSHFIDEQNEWIEILKIVNQKSNSQKLDAEYQATKNNATFIVGDQDRTIGSELFIQYVSKNLGHEVHIVTAHHSPLLENMQATLPIIADRIPVQKRWWFWRKIYH